MTIREILQKKKVSLSFEVFPPKRDVGLRNVFESARELSGLHPDYMSITYGAGGTTHQNTVEVASKIASFHTPPLAHLTCVGNTRESIGEVLARMKDAGVENVLALRGDVPQGMDPELAVTPGLEHASDLVPLLKDAGFCVGGACYPEGHPESLNREQDIENLRFKVDAGIDFLVTQMFFDNNMLYSYLYRLQSKGIHLPVVAGVMPITSASQVTRMVKLSNAYVPAKLLSFCDKFAEHPEAMRQAGIDYATDQIIDLVSNGVRGIHIYTMNKPSVARDILRNVDAIIAASNGE